MTSINIALVGKTGHGKSSTGNTILQQKYFDEATAAIDGTEVMAVKRCDIDSKTTLKIYDLPGLMSLVLPNKKKATKLVIGEMKKAMDLAKEIHVFIFVFRYPGVFTEEEIKAVQELKKILGKNFLKEKGIIVFTHKDECEHHASERKVSSQQHFNYWCQNSGNDLKKILQEVGEDFLLVNNKGDFADDGNRKNSSKELRRMILKVSDKKNQCARIENATSSESRCIIM